MRLISIICINIYLATIETFYKLLTLCVIITALNSRYKEEPNSRESYPNKESFNICSKWGTTIIYYGTTAKSYDRLSKQISYLNLCQNYIKNDDFEKIL